MSRFLTPLDVQLVDDTKADGRGWWALKADLVYLSDVARRRITVPKGYETDFASVPRVPIAYWLTGDTAHMAAVVHDWLYTTGLVPRDMADEVLLEAMAVEGVPAWRRYAMYWAVRAFGGGHFAEEKSPPSHKALGGQ